MPGRGSSYGTREWEWDPSHFPLPLTPSFGSVYPRWMQRAFRGFLDGRYPSGPLRTREITYKL